MASGRKHDIKFGLPRLRNKVCPPLLEIYSARYPQQCAIHFHSFDSQFQLSENFKIVVLTSCFEILETQAGYTALHLASKAGSVEICELLKAEAEEQDVDIDVANPVKIFQVVGTRFI